MLIAAKEIIQHKNLTISFNKVKAHVGIALNELADQHAKNAAYRNDIHETYDYGLVANLSSQKLVCRKNQPIERYSRLLIKEDFQAKYKAETVNRLTKLWNLDPDGTPINVDITVMLSDWNDQKEPLGCFIHFRTSI